MDEDAKTGDDAGAAWWRAAGLAVLALAIGLRIAAFSPWPIHHPDEFLQYLEQAHRLATGAGLIPWENREGIRNAVIPLILAAPMRMAMLAGMGGIAPVILARVVYAVLASLTVPAAWLLGAARSPRHALAAAFVAASFSLSVLYSLTVLSESLATALIVLAAGLLARDDAGSRRMAFAGFLLALGVVVRLQYAVFVVPYAVMRLRLDWRGWVALALGGIVALAGSAVVDLSQGQVPFGWVVANLHANIGEGRAAMFGTTPVWFFLAELAWSLGPLVIVILPAALTGAGGPNRRFLPLLVAALVTLGAHLAIAHKEPRFVWIALLVLLVLAAIRTADWVDGRASGLDPRRRVVVIAAGWALASLGAFANGAGFNGFRAGGPVAREAWLASRGAGACAIGLSYTFHNHVVPAILERAVPLYVDDKRASPGLSPAIPAAANVLLLAPDEPAPPSPWQRVGCDMNGVTTMCRWQRAGACDAAAGAAHTYQAMLDREAEGKPPVP